MKKLFVLLMVLGAALPLAAQEYEVASVNGGVYRFLKGQPAALAPLDILRAEDTVLIAKHSSLAVLNGRERQLHSLGENPKATLAAAIRKQSGSSAGRFAERFVSALRRGDTEKISHDANVVYKDATADMLIYAAIRNPSQAAGWPMRLELMDCDTHEAISGEVRAGRRFYFRITNDAPYPLFVNVLDIDSEGGMYDCLPIDEGGAMLHALIPAGSTTDLREYPMEFSEPAGTDRLVLVGYDKPFDLRNVIKAFGENREFAPRADGVAKYEITINIR